MSLTRTKLADFQSSQDRPFEHAFAQLAYANLKDKSPNMLDKLVGFQLVDRTDNGEKAFGVLGFKAGEDWLEAPCFFIKGELKGHELLFIPGQDLFVPMKEAWTNFVTQQREQLLGEPSKWKPRELSTAAPDFRQFLRPDFAKFASDKLERPKLSAWAARAVRNFAKAAYPTKKASDLIKNVSLEDILSAEPAMARLLKKWASDYPTIAHGIERFHGKNFFDRVERRGAELMKKLAQSRLLAARSKTGSLLGDPPAKSRANVHVTIYNEISAELLPDIRLHDPEVDDPSDLLRDGYKVTDRRSEDQKSKLYTVSDADINLSSPSESGVYGVLDGSSKLVDCAVFTDVYSKHGMRVKGCLVVTTSSPRLADCQESAKIFAHWKPGADPAKKLKSFISNLPDFSGSSLKEGGKYVLVTEDGRVTTPFDVNRKINDDLYEVWYSGPYVPCSESYSFEDGRVLAINRRKGTKICSNGQTLQVPAKCKVIVLDEPSGEGSSHSPETCCSRSRRETSFRFGTISQAIKVMTENTLGLKGERDKEGQYKLAFEIPKFIDLGVREQRVVKADRPHAMQFLVEKIGLDEASARSFLDIADTKTISARVKVANPNYDLLAEEYGVNLPPDPGVSMDISGLPVQEGYEMELDTLHPINENKPIPLPPPDPMTMQQASSAAAKGQQQVFDVSLLTGLSRTVRQDALVGKFLGPLIKALDSLGRLLFLFYWHGYEFEERYGAQDLPELEDSLRNTFDTLGDLVLFLRKKEVRPFGAASEFGEPDVSEATGD